VNVRGTFHTLEAARICGVERFIFTSSVAAYGLHLPAVVDDKTIQRPIGMYGVTKVFGEQLGTFYRRRFGLDFRSIRYPQVIGPGVKAAKSGVFMSTALVVEAAVRGEPFEMTIEEDIKVPVIYYKDAIEATSCLIHAPKENIVTINYNLAEIKPRVTARKLVDVVRSIIPTAKITFVPDPLKAEIGKSVAVDYDDSRLRQETGYNPTYDLETAIKDYIKEVQTGSGLD
jgi:nucleoside-diphosphate-sugar epimerase